MVDDGHRAIRQPFGSRAKGDVVMGRIAKLCVAAIVCMLVGTTAYATPLTCDLTESKCDSGKYLCVAKLESCLLACYRTAFSRGKPADGPCLERCREKFSSPSTGFGCIDKLDLKNDGCSTLGDGPALRANVDVHMADLL